MECDIIVSITCTRYHIGSRDGALCGYINQSIRSIHIDQVYAVRFKNFYVAGCGGRSVE